MEGLVSLAVNVDGVVVLYSAEQIQTLCGLSALGSVLTVRHGHTSCAAYTCALSGNDIVGGVGAVPAVVAYIEAIVGDLGSLCCSHELRH